MISCSAQITYCEAQHVMFPPGKLVRLWIRDRTITRLVGIPDHVVWSLEQGSLFFESSLGCSFCVYDELMTPYDITATPSGGAQTGIQLDAQAPLITPEHIQTFLLSSTRHIYQRTWRNTSRQTVSLANLHAQDIDTVVIAQKSSIHPGEAITYFAVPKTALAQH